MLISGKTPRTNKSCASAAPDGACGDGNSRTISTLPSHRDGPDGYVDALDHSFGRDWSSSLDYDSLCFSEFEGANDAAWG